MTGRWSRREFLRALGGGGGCLLQAAALLPPIGQVRQDSLPGAGPSGRLYQPEWAGRPADPVTARDNLAAIQAIEKGLRCTCGCGLDIYTCRTTDFNCTYSPKLHREVLAQFTAGKTAQEIIDGFVSSYGVEALMAPPRRGFNLIAYFTPGAAVLLGGGLLFLALRRWARAAASAGPAPRAAADATPAELERLRRELSQLDT